jgi:capsular exopolysaccharide synthesis family protein
MPEGLVPQQPSSSVQPPMDYAGGDVRFAPAAPEHGPLDRPMAALRRYKWLILALVAVSTTAGAIATRFISPKYNVRATIWVATAPSRAGAERSGPIRSEQLLASAAWIELFRSYRVVDEVVRKLGLYVSPFSAADRPLFANFELADRFAAGTYELSLDARNRRWVLSTAAGSEVERGAIGDSIGRRAGFKWLIPDGRVTGTAQRTVKFSVIPPRDQSLELLDRVENKLALGSNFLWLAYADKDRAQAQRILNTWVAEFVKVAADLKKRNLVEYSKILETQLHFAEQATQNAEAAYQHFRVNTIILPTEAGPVAARSVEAERDPALASFFEQKVEYDNLRHDREALEQTVASAAAGRTPYEGLLFIPSVAQSPGAEALRETFRSVYALEADLRVKQQTFTAQHPAVIELSNAIDGLRKVTIPEHANRLLQQLRDREKDYERRIQAASRELREIPPRTIEERRLSRAVSVSEGLYTNLKSRFAEAQLAEAGAAPDVSVLDTAVAPLWPSSNTRSMVLLGAIMFGLGAAVALALLLDQVDRKLRYAQQATSDLGLVIAGTVPRIPKGGIDATKPEQVIQFLESFRTLRMHVLQSAAGGRISIAVTSAAPGDGKSLVSANLALSFAEAGFKTVLVDGDTRRGALHRVHGVQATNGLTEYLAGSIEREQALQATQHPNLKIISSGVRHQRSPELLTNPRLKNLITELGQSFDVIIFDTPPLAAGIDAYAISAATGRVLMVLRMGQTERRLASAKLSIMDRLPVDVIGAVLNAVPDSGEFQYYSYAAGYGIEAQDRDLVGSGA